MASVTASRCLEEQLPLLPLLLLGKAVRQSSSACATASKCHENQLPVMLLLLAMLGIATN